MPQAEQAQGRRPLATEHPAHRARPRHPPASTRRGKSGEYQNVIFGKQAKPAEAGEGGDPEGQQRSSDAGSDNKPDASTTSNTLWLPRKKLLPMSSRPPRRLPPAAEAEDIIAKAKAEAAAIVAEAQAKAKETLEAAKETAPAAPKPNDLVPIRLFKDNDKYKDDVFVAVNGRSFQIKRGETVQVPAYVAEVLEQSMAQDNATANLIERESSAYAAEAKARNI